MNKPQYDIVIYNKDVQIILRCKRNKASRVLKKVRESYNKGREHVVTLFELCTVLKIDAEMALVHLNQYD